MGNVSVVDIVVCPALCVRCPCSGKATNQMALHQELANCTFSHVISSLQEALESVLPRLTVTIIRHLAYL